MNSLSLSLAQSPPLWVPARFFATAPVFGVLAAALLLWATTTGLPDRWTPAVLAATHLLTLGYMGMIMLGALMQIFPVVIGHGFRRPSLVSALVHGLLTLGVLLLAAGFLAPSGFLMLVALACLLAAVLIFLGAAAGTLVNVAAWGDTARTIAMALAAFAVMTGLGVWLALGHTSHAVLPRAWTDIHAGWGLAGWVPLLLMSVAYQVVPMFQITPNYPTVLRRSFPVVLFTMLVATTLAHGLELAPWLERAPRVVAALVLVGFAVTTLVLQHRRRRSRRDVTVVYWQLGMSCLILAVSLWLAGQWLAPLRTDARFPLLLGVLMIPGFSLSVINGMLYKIVPFLVWLHLTMAPGPRVNPTRGRVPGVKQMIPAHRAWLQLWGHAAALLLITAGVLGVPGMLAAGVLVFAAACIRLGLDIASALRLYVRIRDYGADTPQSPGASGPAV